MSLSKRPIPSAASLAVVALLMWLPATGSAATTTFTDLNPATRPTARTGPKLVSDGQPSEKLYMFGGNTGASETWVFDADPAVNQWTLLAPGNTPPKRGWFGADWDSAHAQMVVFGGLEEAFNQNVLGDMHSYDPAANAWTPISTMLGDVPPPLWQMVFRYVSHLGRFLVFSGGTAASTMTQVDGVSSGMWWVTVDPAARTATWQSITPAGGVMPQGRAGACFDYDPVSRRLYLFGGEIDGGAIADTWEYDVDANTWEAISPGGSVPSTRMSAMCAFDARSRQLLMYGGNNRPGGTIQSTLYAYEPTKRIWRQLAPSPSPSALTTGASTYSTARGGMIYFGGRVSLLTTSNKTQLVRVNAPPLADAGADQSVSEGSTVAFSGTASDADGDTLSWSWTQVSGSPTVTLTGADTATPGFTAPTVLTETALEFELTTGDGVTTDVDRVTVTVLNTLNEDPVADAGPDQTVAELSVVLLDGSNSSDPNGDSLTHGWTQTAGPAVSLVGAGTATPSFSAPAVSADATLEFTLLTEDGLGGSSTDSVVITVQNLNDPPVANAGTDQVVGEGATVSLSGSGSDPNGDALVYAWTQVAGSPVVALSGADTAAPGFTAPAVTAEAAFEFELTVRDGKGGSATDRVLVTVRNSVNEAPSADAGSDQTVGEGTAVSLHGSGSDPNGDGLAFAWAQVSGAPVESLAGATTPSPSFTAPAVTADTVLEFALTVIDGLGGVDVDSVRVTVQNTVNEAPVADAGSDQTVGEGEPVSLSGSGSDPNGDALTYAWTQVAGSPMVAMSGAATATPGFTAPAVTVGSSFEFELTVRDGKGGSAADRVRVTVQNTANDAPTADAGADQLRVEGDLVSLDGSASHDPNGDPLTFAWTQSSGPQVALLGADSPAPRFVAPSVDAEVVVELTLVVTDPSGASGSDRVAISIRPNGLPVADAGQDLRAPEGEVVTLDGSASSDPDGDTLAFAWSQISGPAVVLSGPDSTAPSLTTPSVIGETALEFELTVTDPRGGVASDRVLVVVEDTRNNPPTADAGADRSVAEGESFVLDATGSADPEGLPLAAFEWRQTAGPAVALPDPQRPEITATAPQVFVDTALEFELRVTDAAGLQAVDRVSVTVTNTINDAPVAVAGPEQSVFETIEVRLDGSGSRDPNGDAVVFEWQQDGGVPVALSDPASASPRFVAPPVAGSEELSFTLTVRDPQGLRASSSVRVTVLPIALSFEAGCGCQDGAGFAPQLTLAALALALLRRRRAG